MSLGMTLMPFVGQNFGAKRYDRICEGRRFSMRFALFFLTGAAIIFNLFADQIVVLFKDDPEICRIMAQCLRITSWGFAGVEIHRFAGFFYTGCGKPSASAWLNAMRIIGLLIPLSLVALWMRSLTGLFIARLAADVISAVIGYALVRRMTNRLDAGFALKS
jgi:Na+-driven multidrug efflux pump